MTITPTQRYGAFRSKHWHMSSNRCMAQGIYCHLRWACTNGVQLFLWQPGNMARYLIQTNSQLHGCTNLYLTDVDGYCISGLYKLKFMSKTSRQGEPDNNLSWSSLRCSGLSGVAVSCRKETSEMMMWCRVKDGKTSINVTSWKLLEVYPSPYLKI